jgi:signal transduction histidine kinase
LRLGLRGRFVLSFMALIAPLMALVVLLVDERMGALIVGQTRARGLAIARNLAAVSQPALMTYNYVALTQNAERAKRDDELIAEVIILDKEGRVAAYSQHGERLGTVLTDPLSVQAAATTSDLVVPVTIPRPMESATDRALDIVVPVFVERSPEKWGTVRVRILIEDMHRQIFDTRLALVGLGLGAMVLGVAGAYVLARRITEPLRHLAEGTLRAASGDLDARIEAATGDEIEEVARSFNEMIAQIRANQRAVEELNRHLEEKVQARTEDLSRTNDALSEAYAELQQAQSQMILREKMASLGQFVAGIAHEINTPASAINAAVFNVQDYLEALSRQIPDLLAQGVPPPVEDRFHAVINRAFAADALRRRSSTVEVRERSRELEAALARHGVPKTRDLSLTFARLGLHEEVAALVDAAGPATPAAWLAFLETLGSLAVATHDIRVSIEAITRMVKALKGYSHPDQAEMSEGDIHDGIETTLTILRNQVKYGVVVERRYARLPLVTHNVNELNQVWTNIIHNAIQAMQGMGRITIETAPVEDGVAVRITDTGPGIPESIRGRIFDPFFTTKDQGEGSGLGLCISQQIVERHGGRIVVTTEPGRTTFEVRLPLIPRPPEGQRVVVARVRASR